MSIMQRFVLTFILLTSAVSGRAQSDRIAAPDAIARSLKVSSLTDEGTPFHAVLKIGDPTTPYTGSVEVWWAGPAKYKAVLLSPNFSQTRIVNGQQVMETNQGDYYPRWLENFRNAILDPIPMAKNFQALDVLVMLGPQFTRSCISRDDRPGGITDQMTWGSICFAGGEPRVLSVQTTNYYLEFGDWQRFGKKQIARTVSTDVLDYRQVTAQLTVLEPLSQPDDAFFTVTSPTPRDQQISTSYVSTLQEERMVEKAPDINWPLVREGKTEGYMIVYARTDRTGQVRETAKHNSDQPGLESFGMEQALRFKFKPLLVNGTPVQMEMPLVLHFTSKLSDPLPILSDAEMRMHISHCKIPTATSNTPPLRVRVSVNEEGKFTGETFLDANNPNGRQVTSIPSFAGCKFSPLLINGKPTYYHGDLLLP